MDRNCDRHHHHRCHRHHDHLIVEVMCEQSKAPRPIGSAETNFVMPYHHCDDNFEDDVKYKMGTNMSDHDPRFTLIVFTISQTK